MIKQGAKRMAALAGELRTDVVQVREGGSRVLVRKLGTSAYRASFALAVLCFTPLVVVTRLLKPIVVIRFATLYSARIGHFAGETNIYLLERRRSLRSGFPKYIDVIGFGRSVANPQLAAMWKRQAHILPHIVGGAMSTANELVPGAHNHRVPIGMTHGRDPAGLSASSPPVLTFTEAEIVRGEALLREFGVAPDDTVVCLLVRDGAYLTSPAGVGVSRHDFRDSSIDSYRLAAETLADRGGFVFRMGQVVTGPLTSEHPRVIDYASDDRRSAFLDIYLAWRCQFAISTSSGWDAVPEAFKRPIATVNYAPVGYAQSWSRGGLVLFRQHTSIVDDQPLSLREVFQSGVAYALETSEFAAANVRLVENSPEELRDIAIEMWERLHGLWVEDPEDRELQERFRQAFCTDGTQADGVPLHGVLNMRCGAQFLRENPWWLA